MSTWSERSSIASCPELRKIPRPECRTGNGVSVGFRDYALPAQPRTSRSLWRAGDLTIDYAKHRVYVAGQDANLTQNEYRLVALLGLHAGKVLTYDYLIRELWGPSARSDNQILRVNMANIRRKIEQNPAQPVYIFTEVGIGYRMIEGD